MKKVYARSSDWNGHDWRCSTRKGEYASWRCVNGCELRVSVSSRLFGNIPPARYHLDNSISELTCNEIIAKTILES